MNFESNYGNWESNYGNWGWLWLLKAIIVIASNYGNKSNYGNIEQ